MSDISLVSRELTYLDMEFQKSDITSKDKLQNIVNEIIEDGESNSTAHVVLGNIDAHNKNNLIEKYFTTESYDESDKGLSISINNLGNLVNEPSEGKITLIYYYYYSNSSHNLQVKGDNKKLIFDIKDFQNEAIVKNSSTKDYELTNEDASDGSLISLACMFDDGYMIIGTKKELSIFIDEVMEYIEE
tara:strand:- start:215 stop:778 length:564 start_codon:yes stop_codon:yes gene_type:complete